MVLHQYHDNILININWTCGLLVLKIFLECGVFILSTLRKYSEFTDSQKNFIRPELQRCVRYFQQSNIHRYTYYCVGILYTGLPFYTITI